jgi:hypothetical protein
MKFLFILSFFFFLACNSGEQKHEEIKDSTKANDSIVKPGDSSDSNSAAKTYSNERFRDVTVERVGENYFRIKGKAQIFEATFGWAVEDGHDELKNGFQMTDAGAPEWGNFDFTVEVQKKDPVSTLHIILFEASAKDGSRQYELPVLLY